MDALIPWLPSTVNYASLLARARVALAAPGAKLGGYVLMSGLNDAKSSATTAGADWAANSAAMIMAYMAALGDAPVYVIRYSATKPAGVDMPSHEAVRASIGSSRFATAVVDAPEGPWAEGPAGVHLATSANLVTALRLDAAIR
jgi:hypothetical protein